MSILEVLIYGWSTKTYTIITSWGEFTTIIEDVLQMTLLLLCRVECHSGRADEEDHEKDEIPGN